MHKGRYIDPLLDFSFKKLFGTDKELLLNLLNAVFNGRKHLIDLQYNKNEHHGDNQEEGLAVFDLLCTTDQGHKILIEVQHSKPANFKKRSIFYTSRLISEQAPKGKMADWKYNISEVYFIALIDQKESEETQDKLSRAGKYLHDICLTHRDTSEIFYDGLGYIYIDLTNFTKPLEECHTEVDKWIHELIHMPLRKSLPPEFKHTIFEKFYSIGEYANLSKEEKHMYDQEMKRKWDNEAVLSHREEIGEARGEAKGRREGGAAKALEIAKNFKSLGIPVEKIAEGTGLTIEEIEQL